MTTLTSGRLSSHQDCRAIQARNRRVEQYKALVRPIALHYHHRCSEPLDDLIQVGLMGLLRAAELYRPSTATPFEAFARPHVRGALLHYLRDVALPIRLPRRLDEQRLQLARLRSSWLAAHHRPATEQELRQLLGLDQSHWNRLQAAEQLVRVQSLDFWLDDGGEPPCAETETGPADPCRGEEASAPAALLAGLEEPLRQVVERVILAGWSYRRTASALNVSPMTVQRRLHRALALLRGCLISPEQGWRHAASAAPGC
ncbi:group3 RNA polymerase sigma factor SigF1 [Cyanobium sp. PCC 7001]|uniref:sigma-70 family RNA polymerase sigma factor n=1 Tax=Cyanobium sp. PCC 7001 TaxID=180281 RepID=UPI0001805681|nr:sigma-70 family RNA polymerase sigma factor [Cyanobium sp. PCC 7001]EDY38675.1 group3 RNA polymerase sigma factor SigF1 [Cyanobium sp. PCC 7001]